MRRRYSSFVLAVLMVLGIGSLANAQRGAWQYLGSANVDGNVDHDKIKCHGKDTFHSIQLRVKGSAVHFDHVVVGYGNHNQETLPVRSGIKAGGSTNPLDLRGANRDIAYVELWHEKAHWGSQPEVRLYGRP